jgi:hypothetical protein
MSYETNHQIGVKASPEEIYKTLTDVSRSSLPVSLLLTRLARRVDLIFDQRQMLSSICFHQPQKIGFA